MKIAYKNRVARLEARVATGFNRKFILATLRHDEAFPSDLDDDDRYFIVRLANMDAPEATDELNTQT